MLSPFDLCFESSSEELDESLEEDEDEESLEESDAIASTVDTWSAITATSGRSLRRTRIHLCDRRGRPLTVFTHTVPKLVGEAKFWVTAVVMSKLRTTCHQPPGTNTVSPTNHRIRSLFEPQDVTTRKMTVSFNKTFINKRPKLLKKL